MTTGNLCSLQLETLHLGHIVAETSVCNVSGNGTGCVRCSGCNRRNGITVQGGAVPCGDTAKGSGHKASASAKAHSLATLHHCITHIRIGIESGNKARCKASSCSTGSCSRTSGCVSGSAEHTAGTSGTAAYAYDHTGCH